MVLSASMRAGVTAFNKAVSTDLVNKINYVLCLGGVLTERLISLIKLGAKKEN